jgi:VanZ family protein
MARLLKKYYPSIIVSLIIIWLSLTDSDAINANMLLPFPYSDKIAHLLAYAGFTMVLLFDSCNRKITQCIHYRFLIIPVLFGLIMEFLQYLLTKTRQADYLDFIADLAGIITCLLFVFFLRALITVKKKD